MDRFSRKEGMARILAKEKKGLFQARSPSLMGRAGVSVGGLPQFLLEHG